MTQVTEMSFQLLKYLQSPLTIYITIYLYIKECNHSYYKAYN